MGEKLQVLFEDNHCIVVAKPARTLTASDKTRDETLLEQVRAYNAANMPEGKKGYLVPIHFLDRPVSGIVMFARSSKAAARLSEQFRAGKIEKTYQAIVESFNAPREGLLEDFLLKNHKTNVVETVPPNTPEAKKSALKFRLLKQENKLAWLEINPLTGRSHQIRVQLSSRRLPIYGDTKYGASQAWDGCIALHAIKVVFEHPTQKNKITVDLPVPVTWQTLWKKENGLVAKKA